MRAVASAFAGAKNAVMALEFVWSAARVIISRSGGGWGRCVLLGRAPASIPGMERAPSTNYIVRVGFIHVHTSFVASGEAGAQRARVGGGGR